MGDIAIAVLDLNRESSDFAKFNGLPAEEKIHLMAKHITEVCESLQKSEPNSMWIVTWREYGITNGFERSLTSEQKQLFKKTLTELVEKFHPNLTIVAGTVATKKKVNKEKLKNIAEYYAEHGWIKEKEAKWETDQQQISKEETKLKSIQDKEDQESAFAVRNTCYIVTSEFNEQKEASVRVWRHDKIAPFNETNASTDDDKIEVFQPGKGRNLSPYCTLTHPITGELITIGVEICREHDFQNLKKNLDNQSVLLQMVMSDSVVIRPTKLCGKYVMPLDSKYKPRLYTKQNNLNNLPIRWYQTDMLNNYDHLTGPLEINYPFEIRVTDLLLNAILRLPSASHNREILSKILDEFYEAIYKNRGEKVDVVYDALEKALNKHAKSLEIAEPLLTTVFTQQPRLNSLIETLYNLIEEEKAKQLPACCFLGKTDASLQDKQKLFIDSLDNFNIETALDCVRNHNVLSKIKLTNVQFHILIQMVSIQAVTEQEQKFYFEKIFADNYPLLKENNSFLEGKSFLQLFCERNMHEALNSALPAFKDSINDISEDGKTLLGFAIEAGADDKTINLLTNHGADLNLLPSNKKTK